MNRKEIKEEAKAKYKNNKLNINMGCNNKHSFTNCKINWRCNNNIKW